MVLVYVDGCMYCSSFTKTCMLPLIFCSSYYQQCNGFINTNSYYHYSPKRTTFLKLSKPWMTSTASICMSCTHKYVALCVIQIYFTMQTTHTGLGFSISEIMQYQLEKYCPEIAPIVSISVFCSTSYSSLSPYFFIFPLS